MDIKCPNNLPTLYFVLSSQSDSQPVDAEHYDDDGGADETNGVDPEWQRDSINSTNYLNQNRSPKRSINLTHWN